MNRRQFLRKTGTVGAIGMGGAASRLVYGEHDENQDPSDTTDLKTKPQGMIRHAGKFRKVVNAVNAGVDPEGGTPINEFLETHAADDTLLSFSAGTYRLQPTELSEFSNLGIAAASSEPMTIVPIETECGPGDPYLLFESIDNLLLDGIQFDFRREGGGGSTHLLAQGETTVQNVRIAGSCSDQISMLRVDVRDDEGSTVIENLVAHNTEENSKLTGVYVGKRHAGAATFRECNLSGFSDNGLYASSPGHPDGRNGIVHVVDGMFKNNNIANIRLGSTGSTARGVTIASDAVPPSNGSVNARGIRLREQDGQIIEDCDIHIGQNAGHSFGAIVFHPDVGGNTILDTEITVDRDTVPAINALPRSEEAISSAPVFKNLTIDGNAADGYAVSIDGRNGTVFRNCTITQPGADRGGIRISNSSGCQLINSRINVTGAPIKIQNGDLLIRNSTLVTSAGRGIIEEARIQNDDQVSALIADA